MGNILCYDRHLSIFLFHKRRQKRLGGWPAVNSYWFDYEFQMEDGTSTRFKVELDPDTLYLVQTHLDNPPDWSRLDFKQCPCCPLKPETNPYCPIAINIAELVERFKDVYSYNNCMVICATADRTYSKETSVMEGLSSIFSIIMATSRCPVMDFFRPMARFHLPFATIEENLIRAASMFLLRQYYEYKRSLIGQFELESLENHYSLVQQINEGLLERIKSLGTEDADKNAMVTLHSLSSLLATEIDYNLTELEYMFTPRTESDKGSPC